MKKVLVINCGSSSLKYQLIDMETEAVEAKGLAERIGIDGRLKHTPAGKDTVVIEEAMPDHNKAVELVIGALTNPEYGVIKDMSEITAVGHRVVHGGEKFNKSVLSRFKSFIRCLRSIRIFLINNIFNFINFIC